MVALEHHEMPVPVMPRSPRNITSTSALRERNRSAVDCSISRVCAGSSVPGNQTGLQLLKTGRIPNSRKPGDHIHALQQHPRRERDQACTHVIDASYREARAGMNSLLIDVVVLIQIPAGAVHDELRARVLEQHRDNPPVIREDLRRRRDIAGERRGHGNDAGDEITFVLDELPRGGAPVGGGMTTTGSRITSRRRRRYPSATSAYSISTTLRSRTARTQASP